MEIIERKLKMDKKELITLEFQVSYNSDGHIVFRLFDKEKENKDVLIVFTAEESRKLMGFLRRINPLFDC